MIWEILATLAQEHQVTVSLRDMVTQIWLRE